MADKYEGFKYEIGDFVSPVIPDNFFERTLFEESPIFRVCGRLYEECPGGVQLHYACRLMNRNGYPSDDPVRLHEMEIEPAKPIEPRRPTNAN